MVFSLSLLLLLLLLSYRILHQDSNDNGVRIVNFATSKNLFVKSTMFPHRNIHKYTWKKKNLPDIECEWG